MKKDVSPLTIFSVLLVLINTYSMKQPDLYYFEAIEMTSPAWSNFVWGIRATGVIIYSTHYVFIIQGIEKLIQIYKTLKTIKSTNLRINYVEKKRVHRKCYLESHGSLQLTQLFGAYFINFSNLYCNEAGYHCHDGNIKR